MKWLDKIKIWFNSKKYGIKRFKAVNPEGKVTGYMATSPKEYLGKIAVREDVQVIPNPNPSEYTMKQVGGIEKLSPNVYVAGTFELYKDGKQIDYQGIPMPQMDREDKYEEAPKCKIGDTTIVELNDHCSIEEFTPWAEPYKGTTMILNAFPYDKVELNPDKYTCNKKQMTKEEMAKALWGEWEVENDKIWVKGRRHIASMVLNKVGLDKINIA
jgi:hypothetical protein